MNFDQLASSVVGNGKVIRHPAGAGPGHWAGAPGVFRDGDGATYMAYRIRRPRGAAPDRGAELHVVRSDDGADFRDLCVLWKDQFNSTSIERCCPCRGDDGAWRLFMAYVDPADRRWRVTVLKAPSLDRLSPAGERPLFLAANLGLEAVKDPWIMRHGGVYHMFLSVALPTAATTAQSHSTFDIYNTGQCVSATALATSADLEDWRYEGVIFQPAGAGWDAYGRRINSVVPCGGGFLAFYDGAAGVHENYEEKTGLAFSTDLRRWRTLTPDAPALTSPHASGSLRYIDAHVAGPNIRLYYELARPDGAHELRMAEVEGRVLEEIAREA